MIEERKGYVFYQSWWRAIKNLPSEIQLEVISYIMEYGFTGKEPRNPGLIAQAILVMAKPQMDANYQRWKNGQKGGCPKGKVNNPDGRRGKIAESEAEDETPVVPTDDCQVSTPEEKCAKPAVEKPDGHNNIDFERLKDYFNSRVDAAGSIFPKISAVTSERRKLVSARIRQYGLEAFRKAIENAVTSDFLNSRSGFGFDWIIRPRNFPKVMEGNYNSNIYGNQGNNQKKQGTVYRNATREPGYGLIED